MTSYLPTKEHLREVVLLCFNLKKSATECCQLLTTAYGGYAPTEVACSQWFRRFKSGDFDVRDKRPGQPRRIEIEELKALLDQDPSLTLENLARSLNVDESIVTKWLISVGYIHKEGNWVPHLLNDKDAGRRLMACEMLLQRHKRKGFLHRIVTGDEKWIYFNNPKRTKVSANPNEPLSVRISKVLLCIWWDQKGVVYYELLKPDETITSERYREQLISLSRALKEKRPEYTKRLDKVIFLHDDAQPHVTKPVKEILEALYWDVLPHPPYSPDIAPSGYHLFRSMTRSLADKDFQSYEDIKKWINEWIESKHESFFHEGIRVLPTKWETVITKGGRHYEM